jgi:anti-anti-sigma factor
VDGEERLRISRSIGPDATLQVAGELDAYTAPALEELLASESRDGDLRLDLSGVSFIDSTGIRVIVKVDNDLRAHANGLVIVAPSPSVLRLLQLTSLDDRIRIEAAP